MKRNAAWLGLLLAMPAAHAWQPVDVGDGAFQLTASGFVEGEGTVRDNRSLGLAHCQFTPDPRGVLGTSVSGGPYCQPGQADTAWGQPLWLGALTMDVNREFDSAWKVDALVTLRLRNGEADIYDQPLMDRSVAISHPVWGELRGGIMTTRAWSRSDSFTYPLGITSAWSESGAGYGLLPQALRYTSRLFELPGGAHLVVEGTLARERIVFAHNAPFETYNEHPPRPQLGELFVQYATESDLIEYIFQGSEGGVQSSFSKGAFTGDVGNADNLANYKKPRENVHILQGEHYFTPQWKLTWGVKRNYWSGEVFQCDFVAGVGCYFPSGFDNGTDLVGHSATQYNFMGGVTRYDGDWSYSLAGVRMNRAYVRSPTEYGQSNTANFFVLAANRRVPELSRNLRVYGNLNYLRYGYHGPAPLSMPNELAVWGVDPRDHGSALGLTLGANLAF